MLLDWGSFAFGVVFGVLAYISVATVIDVMRS